MCLDIVVQGNYLELVSVAIVSCRGDGAGLRVTTRSEHQKLNGGVWEGSPHVQGGP